MIKINLLPIVERPKRAIAIRLPPISIYEFLGFVLLGVVILWVFFSCSITKAKISRLDREIEKKEKILRELQEAVNKVNILARRKTELKVKLDRIEQLIPYTIQEVIVLDEIAQLCPKYLWLSKYTHKTQANNIALEGYAFSSLTIADFIMNLRKSNIFSNVTFKSWAVETKEKIEVIKFFLELQTSPNLKAQIQVKGEGT